MDDATAKGRKTVSDVGIQMPTTKAVADSGTMSGPLVPSSGEDGPPAYGRRWDAAAAAVRTACAVSSLVSLCVMVSAEQRGDLSIYGLSLPLYSKWSFSNSLEYLVGISAAVVAHSLLQILLSARKLVKKSPVVHSRRHAWIILAGDQAFAYAMMSAGSAAAGVTNLNRTGIRHSPLPDFCKPLNRFCDRMAVSIAFCFLSFVFLAVSAILDVIWLAKH